MKLIQYYHINILGRLKKVHSNTREKKSLKTCLNVKFWITKYFVRSRDTVAINKADIRIRPK
jgi:hypothetical protein